MASCASCRSTHQPSRFRADLARPVSAENSLRPQDALVPGVELGDVLPTGHLAPEVLSFAALQQPAAEEPVRVEGRRDGFMIDTLALFFDDWEDMT